MRTDPPTIDHRALYAALSYQRGERRLTWRQMAEEMGIPHSAFTRLAAGGLPAATALVRILLWLGQTDLAPYIRRAAAVPNQNEETNVHEGR